MDTVSIAFLHSYMYVSCTYITQGEGFSPLGETGPPKGEEAALPTTLSPGSAPAMVSVLVVSSISVVGGSSGGGALRKPSLCKQQSLNAKIKVKRYEILHSGRHSPGPSALSFAYFSGLSL